MPARRSILAACAFALLAAAGPGRSEEASADWSHDTLTGDWNGVRTDWYKRGAQVELAGRVDVVSNWEGGFETGTGALSQFDTKLRLDLDRMWGWDETLAYVHLLTLLGSKPNSTYVGSAMGINNSEVTHNTTRFFHAWLQRSFLNERVSLLAGLYPIDSEFYVTASSGVFLHPSYGMSAEVAATGKAGPSIFPVSAFGVRLKVQPDPAWYGQMAVMDGVPGLPENPRGTHIHFGRGDGTMIIGEFGWRPFEAGHPGEPVEPEKHLPVPPEREAEEKYEPFGKYAFGLWRYNPKYDDFVDVDASGNPARHRAEGFYLLAERSLYTERDPSQGLAAFVRYGRTDGDVSPIEWSASVGAIYTGLIEGRNEDVLGLATTRARASDKYRQANDPMDRTETVVELTYRMKLTPWLSVQPSLQRVIHPGFDPALHDATVVQLRIDVAL